MEDDALAPDEDERVGGTQVDREVGGEHAEEVVGEHFDARQQNLGHTPNPAIKKSRAYRSSVEKAYTCHIE
jgi:hypothetical protein